MNRLELKWIGKAQRSRVEPRILIEEPDHSYESQVPGVEGRLTRGQLIRGDNLLALKALEQQYSGRVQCVFIDPPYNTGSAFPQYDDGIEHSLWLSLMRERLEILRDLLATDGSIWITLDDNEFAYCKVLCDEVFGRPNFVSTVLWQKKYAPKSDAKHFSTSHDYVLVYAKQVEKVKLNRLTKGEKQTARYTNRDGDPRGPWKAGDVLRNEVRDYAVFPVQLPSGRSVLPPPGTSWRYTREKFAEMVADNRIWFGQYGDARPAVKRFLAEVTETIPPTTWWTYDEVGHNDEAKKESKTLFGSDLFATPKPERLIKRILELATNPGDIVLDSFAGSGTTGAVAHKMGRRWIMVELGEHAYTHIVPRLRKVVDGQDPGGITEAVGWTGGGGFRTYRLAPSLLEKDRWGNWTVSREYNGPMLAEALCKLEGFTYAPSDSVYWQHGRSTERDYLYVTTATLDRDQLQQLSDEVGPDRTLLVLCAAFRADSAGFDNLTVKKIPRQVLDRCEWGRDDYSLHVESHAARAEPVLDAVGGDGDAPAFKPRGRPRRAAPPSENLDAFAQAGDT